MTNKITVIGRVSTLDDDYHSTRATVNVGEFQTLSERRVTGYLTIYEVPLGSPDWQLGQKVTITITQEAPAP